MRGIPSPAGGLLILMPLIYELTNLNLGFDVKKVVPYFTILIAIMLVSKVPTLALKRISISPKTTVFLLLGIGLVFIALLFYTLETLLTFGLVYLISIPISVVFLKHKTKKIQKYLKKIMKIFYNEKSQKELRKVTLGKLNNTEILILKIKNFRL